MALAQRRLAYVVLGLVVVAMLGPPLRRPPRDSFPLSTYPMFAHHRGRISSVATVVGLTANGEVVRLSPELIAGTDEVMIAVETAANAVRRGRDASRHLCDQVASRVASADRPTITSVRVAVETHDAIDYFSGDRPGPEHVAVHAECAVE